MSRGISNWRGDIFCDCYATDPVTGEQTLVMTAYENWAAHNPDEVERVRRRNEELRRNESELRRERRSRCVRGGDRTQYRLSNCPYQDPTGTCSGWHCPPVPEPDRPAAKLPDPAVVAEMPDLFDGLGFDWEEGS